MDGHILRHQFSGAHRVVEDLGFPAYSLDEAGGETHVWAWLVELGAEDWLMIVGFAPSGDYDQQFGDEVLFPIVTSVAVDGQPLVPEYGDLVVEKESGPDVSPIGRGGRFYFERVPPGRYPATVRYHGASCGFTRVVPTSRAPVGNTGAHSCQLEAKTP